MSKWQDNEIVEIVEDSDMKETEEEPITEEEVNLAQLGIMPERAQHFYKKYPNGIIFKDNQLTKPFFEWLLGVVDEDELKAINATALSNELQMMLLEKQSEGIVNVKETPLQQYIDRNKELMARNKFLEDESLELKKSVKFYDDIGRKFFSYAKFLYDFMGTKTTFKNDITVDDEEMQKIEEIKEGLNKK